MAQVSVTIAGKAYRMGCDDGQEEHLAELAADLDQRIGGMRKAFGEIGEMRLTIMAAVALTDELSEQKRRLDGLEAAVASLTSAASDAGSSQARQLTVFAGAIDALTARIESAAEVIGGRAEAEE